MAVQFMSADAQERLLNIAKTAVEMARDGECTPSEALAKLASDNQLNSDEISRITEAMNTASVLALRKRAASGESVATDDVVPLVNSSEVLGKVFADAPNPNALALKKVAADADVAETRSFISEVGGVAGLSKAASATPAKADGLTREQLYDRAHGQIGQLKIAAETHRENAAAHRFAAERRIGDVLDVFRRTAAPSFEAVEKVASALYPGEGLGLVFDMIYRSGELDKLGHKRFTGELPKYASVTEHADIIAEVRKIRDDIGHALLAKIAEDEYSAKVDRGRITLFKLADEGPLGEAVDTVSDIADKAVGGVGGLMPQTERSVDALSPSQPKHSINERLKSELSNDRLRVVLGNVMNDDPVISKHPQDKVIQAYNELTTLQPSLSGQPLALRAALRRYLVSGGDFTMQEASQLYDFNKEKDKLRTKQVVEPGMMGPAPKPAKAGVPKA